MRQTLGDLLSFGDDDDRRGDRHDRFHQVLDDDERDATSVDGANEIERLLDLGGIEAGHHLVEQQDLRIERERLGDLEPLAIGNRQLACGSIRNARETDGLEQLLRALDRAQRRASPPIAAIHCPDRDVLTHAQARERLHDLERTRDAESADPVRGQHVGDTPASELDAAPSRPKNARDEIHQRRLAAAVRADQPDDGALLHVERDLAERLQTAEAHADLVDPQERRAHARYALREARNPRQPPFCKRPRGKNTTTKTITAPKKRLCSRGK